MWSRDDSFSAPTYRSGEEESDSDDSHHSSVDGSSSERPQNPTPGADDENARSQQAIDDLGRMMWKIEIADNASIPGFESNKHQEFNIQDSDFSFAMNSRDAALKRHLAALFFGTPIHITSSSIPMYLRTLRHIPWASQMLYSFKVLFLQPGLSTGTTPVLFKHRF